MRESYDFSKGVKNPCAAQTKKQITTSSDAGTVDYFKEQAEEKDDLDMNKGSGL